jgi:uncharacterized membrane protein
MEKIPLALTIVSVVLAYFSISGQRLIELKIFAVWCGLAVLVISHLNSLYLLFSSTEPVTLIRILTLNVAAMGVLVLLATGVFLKCHLRESLEKKNPEK